MSVAILVWILVALSALLGIVGGWIFASKQSDFYAFDYVMTIITGLVIGFSVVFGSAALIIYAPLVFVGIVAGLGTVYKLSRDHRKIEAEKEKIRNARYEEVKQRLYALRDSRRSS